MDTWTAKRGQGIMPEVLGRMCVQEIAHAEAQT
ncbi:MAG: hypothetical protein ACI8W7_001966 [Gammaproteobacteria bacterium]|jgi:hypothetical protein